MSVVRWADHTDRADRSASVFRKIEIRGIERGEDHIWEIPMWKHTLESDYFNLGYFIILNLYCRAGHHTTPQMQRP